MNFFKFNDDNNDKKKETPNQKKLKRDKKPKFRYKYPLSLFVVFEKMNTCSYTSKKLTRNHFVSLIDKNWYVPVNFFLKNETFNAFSNLTEMSAIDTTDYDDIFPENEQTNKNKFILYNIYYMYYSKIRFTLVYFTNEKIESIDKIYKNSNWLEREVSEMYGIKYINKKDTRPLLLDYSRNDNPMLRDFPTEGEYDIYYNFFENKLSYIKNEFIEL